MDLIIKLMNEIKDYRCTVLDLMYKYYWVKLFKIVPALERNENG
jgi:hypothetical protein